MSAARFQMNFSSFGERATPPPPVSSRPSGPVLGEAPSGQARLGQLGGFPGDPAARAARVANRLNAPMVGRIHNARPGCSACGKKVA